MTLFELLLVKPRNLHLHRQPASTLSGVRICLEFGVVAVDQEICLVSTSPSMRVVAMRSTISVFGIVTILAVAFTHPSSGQTPNPGRAGASAQSPEFGYYVPVLVNDDGVVQAAYSAHLSDDVQSDVPPMPMVAPDFYGGPIDCMTGCACSACDGRVRRGCPVDCSCVGCRHDRAFAKSFGSLEFLHWYNQGMALPPLVTTNIGIPAQGDAGVLTTPTTRVLFGDDEIDDSRQSGMRLIFGTWLDDRCNTALAAKFYDVEGGDVRFNVTGNGARVLGIPFFNSDPLVNSEDALLLSYPGRAGGTSIIAGTDVIGGEIFGRSLLDMGRDYRVDLIGGYQFARIASNLEMTSQVNTGAANFVFNDLFQTENEFHGFAAGLHAESYSDCFTISAMGKIAIGNMRQTANIQGSNSVTAGGTVTTDGGLFAQPSNIGFYDGDEFVWSPEVNIKLSCAITRRFSMSVGYTFLYFDQVALAGDQIDRNVNATQLNGGALVGPIRPAFEFNDGGFWIQTIDIGGSFNY